MLSQLDDIRPSESFTDLQGLEAQLRQREDEMLKLETVHKLIRVQLEGRAAEAEARAARLSRHAAAAEQRRMLDLEVGLGAGVALCTSWNSAGGGLLNPAHVRSRARSAHSLLLSQ